MDNQSSSNQDLLPIGDLFSKTWEVYKERFWTLVGIMAIPILAWLLMGGMGAGVFALLPLLGNASLILGAILAVVAVVVGVLLAFWPQVALIYAVKERGRRIGIKESFAKSWQIINSFIWVSILTGLVTTAGFLLLIIPGIIFAVWFAFSSYVLVVENKKGSAALSRSKKLVSGFWGSVFARTILMGLIAGGVTLLISLIPVVGRLIANLLVTPFSVVFLYLLYEDLKRAKGEAKHRKVERPSGRPQKGISTKVIVSLAILGLVALAGIPTAITMFALGNAQKKASDARITSEMSQLRPQAEIIASEEDSYKSFTCDYDDYVKALCDDIEQQGGEVTIHAGKDAYCAYTSLNEGEYYCIDSFGASREVEVDPSTSCGNGGYKCP